MYKKYVKKRGKLLGPYYYESVREKSGKIKSVYVGKDPSSQKFKEKVALLKLKSAVKKGESVIIPVGNDVERPKRPFKIDPRFLALKYFFGDKVAQVKSNFSKLSPNLPKLPRFSFRLPKVALPEVKQTNEVSHKKLEEYAPHPGKNDFDFHAALFLLLSVIFVFGFFFLRESTIGFTAVIENITGSVGQLETSAGLNVSQYSEESSAIPLVLNILNYSCSWVGSGFKVCESVEWSGGSSAHGYITGGEAANKAERFTVSPFSYCQDIENEGKKAVNAYVLDEKEKRIKSDLKYDVDCIIGNSTIVVLANESIIANYTKVLSKTTNTTQTYGYEENASGTIERIIQHEERVNGNVEKTIQYEAIVGQPVRWKKIIQLENETNNLEVELPKNSKVISVKEVENESVRDITQEVFTSDTPITGLSFLLTGLAVADEINGTSVLIEQPVKEVEVEYETEAPKLYEEDIDNGIRFTLSSGVHYENVYAEITIPETRGELIRLYWIVNGTRELHPIIDYDDNNFDGLIDEIAFVAPHLSTEVFELILITKAEHLDENYTFISDIYNETVTLDDVWSEPIYSGEYVRVTFEKNLTSKNDITFYARNNQSLNTTVEVYYYNTSNKITEFPVITEEKYYKVFLDDLNESYGTFDLRIKNLEADKTAYLEFDHIIDPTIIVIAGNEAHNVDFAIMNASIGEFVMAWTSDVDDLSYWQGFYTNGSSFTNNQSIGPNTARENNRIAISALNDSDFAIAAIDEVTAAAPDWVFYARTKSNGSISERTLIDTDVFAPNTAHDVAITALNATSYVSFVLDGNDGDVTYSVHNRAAGTAQTDLNDTVAPDAGCLGADCVDVATIGNVSSAVANRTRAHVWYNDGSDVVSLAILNGNNQNITGATQNYVNVDASSTTAEVAVSGLYDGRLVVAWCDNSDSDVSFKTYDVAINSSVVSNVSGEVDVNNTVGLCGTPSGTKVAVAALNTTDGQFVILWDDSRINQTSIAIYDSSGTNKVAQTIVNSTTDTALKAVAVVGYDVMRNVSVCEYAPLPAFIIAWNEQNNFYWQTMLNNGSVWNSNGCSSPPVANLTAPTNATSNSSSSHVFLSNASDVDGMSNATLYANFSGSWIVEGNGTVTMNTSTGVHIAYISDSGIAAGGYVWNVLWCDASNNCNFNSQNFTLTVTDTTNPSGINLTNPINNAANRSTSWTFLSNASDDVKLNNATLYHNISGSWVKNQTNTTIGSTGNTSSFTVGPIVNGTYAWNVEWCDTSNNCAQATSNFTFTVDTVAPSGINLTMPPNNTFNTSTTWQFQSNASDNISLANASLYHNISGSWVRNQTNTVSGTNGVVTSFNVSLVAQGGYTWNVEWCDIASNCNQSLSNSTFFVDDKIPSNVNLSSPANAVINTSRNWLFDSNASDNRSLANASLYHNISGSWVRNQTVAVTGTNGVRTQINVSVVADGGYTWNVEWCDEGGGCNKSTANRTFTVNNPPSGINLTNPPDGTNNATTTHNFSSNASDARQLNQSILFHNINGTWAGNQSAKRNGTFNTSGFEVANIAVGTYTWNVEWCDTDGNCSQATSNNTFTVAAAADTTPPNSVNNTNPGNNTINTTRKHKFIANASDDTQLFNATLYHNASGSFVKNETVSWNGTNNQTNFTVDFGVDGGFSWYVLACDTSSSGNCNQSGEFRLTVNNPPRDVNLTGPINGTNNRSTSHNFTSNATDDRQLFNVTLYHNINGTWAGNQTATRNGTNNASGFTVSNIADGSYIWNTFWCDTDGNCSFSTNGTGNFSLVVDTTSPSNVNLTMPPNNAANRSSTWQFQSNASDALNLTNASLYHNITGSWVRNQTNNVTGTNGVVTSFNVSLVVNGTYSWNVEWCDGASNCAQATSNFTFTVDTIAPSNVNLTMPPNNTFNKSTNWLFESNASDNISLANATLYTNTSGSWTAAQTVTVSGSNGVKTQINLTGLSDGGYIWNMEWCDAAGNCNQSLKNSTFFVDATAPSNVTNINPANSTINTTRKHKFIVNITEARALLNASLWHNASGSFTENETVLLNGTSNVTNFTVDFGVDGGFSWYVVTCDEALNCNRSGEFKLTVNNPPRDVNLTGPINGTNNRSTSHNFTSNATDDRQLFNVTLYHNINGTWAGNQTATRNGTNNASGFTVANIADGSYIWNTFWCDTDGNCSFSTNGTGNFSLVVDTTRPSNVNLTMPENNAANRSLTWQFQSNASDALNLTNASLYHNITGSWVRNQTNNVTGTNGVVTSFNVSLVVNGTYSWNVEWCDGASNCAQATSNFTFTVDTVAPSGINLSSPANAVINTSRNWLFDSNASDNFTLANASLYHNISGSWVRNQTVAVTGTNGVRTQINVSVVADGGYTWNVEWCDIASNCNQSLANRTFTVNNPPSGINLTNPPNATSNATENHTFVSNASDARALINASLYHNISGSWVRNQTVNVNGTFNTTSFAVGKIVNGGYTWNVEWCDDDNNCSQATSNNTFTVGGNTAPPTPALLNPTVNNVTTNRTPFFNWTDSIDPDGDPVNYTLNITCRGGCAGDTRIINVVNRTNFTLTDDLEFFGDDGYNYTWTVLATDGKDNSSYNESGRNLSIYTLVDISLPSGNISFGNMSIGTNNDTTDDSPAPFKLQNDGNILINVSINGTSLWKTDPSPTSRYQFKIDNVSGENNSFNWSNSTTTFTNMPLGDSIVINRLNYTDSTDSCEIDINITVPPAEPPGDAVSTVVFRGER